MFLFRYNDYWFWVPIVGQFIGGVVGALLYVLTIEMHHPQDRRPTLLENEIESHTKSSV